MGHVMKEEEDKLIIVSHYGILGEVLLDRRFSVTSPYWDETLPSYAQFSQKYGISPVCLIDNDGFFQFLQPENSGISSTLDKEVELRGLCFDLAAHHSKELRKAYMTHFYFGALRHNLCSLVKAYLETAKRFSRTLAIPGHSLQLQEKDSFLATKSPRLPLRWISRVPVSKVGHANLSSGYAEAVFYQMMAYLTSARSLLDVFHIDPTERTWTSKLKGYTGCLIHHKILSPSLLPSVTAVHSERRIVALQTFLPDNPRARKKFKFEDYIEYLSYAHTTYLRLLDLLSEKVNECLA